MENNGRPIDEHKLVCLVLVVVAGYFEAYTFINCNQVFANSQTANITFIGMNIALGNFNEIMHYLLSIIAFIVGVFLSEIITHKFSKLNIFRYRYIELFLEICLLVFILINPTILSVDIRPLIISFICSVNFTSFRKINNLPFSSTMCTGNLRTTSQHLFSYFVLKKKDSKDKLSLYIKILLSFFIGVIIGSVFSNMYHHIAIVIPMLFLFLDMIIMLLLQYTNIFKNIL